MTIHGCLHLAGYDHMDDIQAAEMESLEEQVMADLGFPAPYGHDEDDSSNA
jgi:probable rRNA maturation factor